jgi:ATP-dependent Clp protease protease subunit
LAAGKQGKRFALPHSRIMIHQPMGGARGQAIDIQIQAAEIQRLKVAINDILHRHTQQPQERLEKDSDRDFFMGAKEAKAYGIIDQVVEHRQTAQAVAPKPNLDKK